jgi:hypothetical protein
MPVEACVVVETEDNVFVVVNVGDNVFEVEVEDAVVVEVELTVGMGPSGVVNTSILRECKA